MSGDIQFIFAFDWFGDPKSVALGDIIAKPIKRENKLNISLLFVV